MEKNLFRETYIINMISELSLEEISRLIDAGIVESFWKRKKNQSSMINSIILNYRDINKKSIINDKFYIKL